MSNDPYKTIRRHRWLKWFWLANFPVCIALFLWAPEQVLLLYLALVSVYANYAGEGGVEQAAESRTPEE